MELVNERFPTGKFRNVDTMFWIDHAYEKGLLATLTLTVHALHKAEKLNIMESFVHKLVRIQHIALMSRIDL